MRMEALATGFQFLIGNLITHSLYFEYRLFEPRFNSL